MKLIVEIDLELGEAKILNSSNLNKRDYVFLISEYFKVPLSELRKLPLNLKKEYVLCRKFITYFLSQDLNTSFYEISRILHYQSEDIIRYNIGEINKGLEIEDPYITRPYNNIKKALTRLQYGNLPKKGNLD